MSIRSADDRHSDPHRDTHSDGYGDRTSPPIRVALHLDAARPRYWLDVQATVVSTAVLSGSTSTFRVRLAEGDSEVDLLFLGRSHVAGFDVGRVCLVEGRAARHEGRLVVWNPRYQLLHAPLSEQRLADLQRTHARAYARASAPPRASADAGLQDQDTDVEPSGRFRIYLGPAAGVGKTYAMLDEAQRRRRRGADVVLAVVETHGRPATEQQVGDLELIPAKVVDYRGAEFHEMDLEAVLARRPEIAVVDELAHSNVPGSGHNEKRWQDVLELLDAGIGVLATLNVQHIESVADLAEQISGVSMRERVPDAVLECADQIELVDSSPEQLRRRMLHGNIYPPERAKQALRSFFRTDTLAALRELTLRYLADEIDQDLLDRAAASTGPGLGVTERILVGVSPNPGTDSVLRRAARIANRVKADLYAVHVADADAPQTDAAGIAELRRLADDVGAMWTELPGTPVNAILAFARDHQITQIVVGRSHRDWWQRLTGGGSTVRRLTWQAMSAGIDVHIVARDRPGVMPPQDRAEADES